jgi:hypothetical protein
MDDDELVSESYDIFSKMFLPTPYPNHLGMNISFEYVAAKVVVPEVNGKGQMAASSRR